MLSDSRSSKSSRGNSHERDADLHSGKKLLGRIRQVERQPCSLVSGFRPLLKPRLPRRNERNLRHCKNAVTDREEEDDDNFNGDDWHGDILVEKAVNGKQ